MEFGLRNSQTFVGDTNKEYKMNVIYFVGICMSQLSKVSTGIKRQGRHNLQDKEESRLSVCTCALPKIYGANPHFNYVI